MTEAQLDEIERRHSRLAVPYAAIEDIGLLAAEVRRLRSLCRDALLELQFPVDSAHEELIAALKEVVEE